MAKEDEIQRWWEENAAQWVQTLEEGRIASRVYTNAAVVRRVLGASPRRVLDAGCGEGWLVRALVDAGVEAWGVDASPALVAAAKQRGKGQFLAASYAAIIGEPGFLPGPYDTAVFNFSLLDESAGPVLRAAGSQLSGHGRIVVQTLHPIVAGGDEYADGWRVETFAGLAGGQWQPMPWYFRTFEGWMKTFRESGYRVESLTEPRDPQTGKVLSVIFELGFR